MASSTPRIDSFARNLAIGGNFDFWQRGTSFASANGYTADRWSVVQGGYTGTVTRSTDVPTQAQSGFNSQYSLLLTNGTGAAPAAGNYQQLLYKMEGYDYQNLHAKKGRIQFWVKSSVTGSFSMTLSGSTKSYVTQLVITTAATWQKIVLDLAFDTSSTGWNFDNTAGLNFIISPTIGSTYQTSSANTWLSGTTNQGIVGQTQWGATTGATFQIAQFMIIPEDLSASPNVDVPFQRAGRTIQHELAMCQRYFEKSYDITDAPGSNVGGTGFGYVMVDCSTGQGPSSAFGAVRFAVPKRSSSTVIFYHPSGPVNQVLACVNGGGTSAASISSGQYVCGQSGFYFSKGSCTVGDRVHYEFCYTADAEL